MDSTPFVGRHQELSLLRGVKSRADAGEPQFVVISGEPGSGKTRLIEQFALEFGSEVRTLRGACVELGVEGMPLAPVTAMLRELVAVEGTTELQALLPGVDVLLALLPELGVLATENTNQALVFDMFRALVERLAQDQPLLLIIDDLHWADRSTRELVGLLARTLRSAPVVLLMGHRSDLPRHHPLRRFLAEMQRVPAMHKIELGAFSRAEITELVNGIAVEEPPDAVVEYIYRRSAGNPYVARELARDGDERRRPGPLSDLLLHRVARLPEVCRRIVRSVVVGGGAVSHDLLAAVTDTNSGELLDAVRIAADAGILVPASDGYHIRNALLREAISEDLLPAERIAIHRDFAVTLEREPQLVAPERFAAQTAFHWYGANEPRRALPALIRAAETAERLFAHAEQAYVLRRVIELSGQAPDGARAVGVARSVLFESAIAAATWAGEHIDALDLIDRALAETDPAREPEQAALLLAHRAMTLANLNRESALTVVDEAWQVLPPSASAIRGRVLDLLAAVLAIHRQPDRARAAALEAMRLAAEFDDPRLAVNAQTTAGWALVQLGHYGEGMAAVNEARTRAAGHGDAVGVVRADLNLAEAALRLGEVESVIEMAPAALANAERAGLGRTLGALLAVQLATALIVTGRWDESDRVSAAAVRLDPPADVNATLHALRAEVAARHGDLDGARSHLSLARTMLDRPGAPTPANLVVLRLVIEVASLEKRGDIHDAVTGALASIEPSSPPHTAWPLLTTLARAVSQGQCGLTSRPDVKALAQAIRKAMSHLPDDAPLWSASALQCTAELGAPDTPWMKVVAGWDTAKAPYPAAYARVRAAESALRSGDRATAEQLLRQAARTAERLSAKPLLEQVTLLARSARITFGDQQRSDAADPGLRGLTGREAEVLRLVMLGRTNRQIGEQLFISHKTVSVHISNILAKLGAASRGEAVAIAYNMRLLDQEPAE